MLQLFGEVVGETGETTEGDVDEGMGLLGWAVFLFAISPFINLLWGGFSLIMALLKVGLRGAGVVHIIFSGTLLLTSVASTNDDFFVEVSVMDFWGIGIWVAMLGGLILLFDSNSGRREAHRSKTTRRRRNNRDEEDSVVGRGFAMNHYSGWGAQDEYLSASRSIPLRNMNPDSNWEGEYTDDGYEWLEHPEGSDVWFWRDIETGHWVRYDG